MTALFVKQPNGLIARFHTASDEFTHWNLTLEEAIQIHVEEAKGDAERHLRRVLAGETKTTWEDCVRDSRHSPEDNSQAIAEATAPVSLTPEQEVLAELKTAVLVVLPANLHNAAKFTVSEADGWAWNAYIDEWRAGFSISDLKMWTHNRPRVVELINRTAERVAKRFTPPPASDGGGLR